MKYVNKLEIEIKDWNKTNNYQKIHTAWDELFLLSIFNSRFS